MKRISCILSLLAVIFVLSAASPAEAAVPQPGAAVTKKNVLALTKAYDKDGYYLLTHGRKNRGMGERLKAGRHAAERKRV